MIAGRIAVKKSPALRFWRRPVTIASGQDNEVYGRQSLSQAQTARFMEISWMGSRISCTTPATR
jgi:hypothetical protein